MTGSLGEITQDWLAQVCALLTANLEIQKQILAELQAQGKKTK